MPRSVDTLASRGSFRDAAGRPVYDEVVVGDLVDARAYGSRSFDVVAASDVCWYFGDLERFNEALRAGALRLVLERARVEIAVFAAGRDERRGGESPRRDVAAASWVPSPFHSPSSVGFRCEAKQEVQL